MRPALLSAFAIGISSAVFAQSKPEGVPEIKPQFKVWGQRFTNRDAAVDVDIWAQLEPRLSANHKGLHAALYRICNLSERSPLYYHWVAAGMRTGSLESYEFEECGFVERKFENAGVDDGPVEFKRALDVVQIVQAPRPNLGRMAPLEKFLLSLWEGAHPRSELTPARTFHMVTARNKEKQDLQTLVHWERSSDVLYIGLPQLEQSDLAGLRRALSFQGYKDDEFTILSSDELQNEFSNQDAWARDWLGKRRVLRLTKPRPGGLTFHQTSPKTNWTDLPLLIVDKTSKRVRYGLTYTSQAP